MTDDDFSITVLVTAAAQGDEAAWNDMVDRYSPLLANVLRQCRLTPTELEDVAQTVWLRLVEHLDSLREARALPMWIITTGRREAWRHAAASRRVLLRDPAADDWLPRPADGVDPEHELIRAERHQALLAGIAELRPRERRLLLLLLEDPPLSYAEIGSRTGMPVGAIGPTRARALDKLRRTPPIQAMMACFGEPAAGAKG